MGVNDYGLRKSGFARAVALATVVIIHSVSNSTVVPPYSNHTRDTVYTDSTLGSDNSIYLIRERVRKPFEFYRDKDRDGKADSRGEMARARTGRLLKLFEIEIRENKPDMREVEKSWKLK